MSSLRPLKKPPKRGLTRSQMSFLAIAWAALSIIIGICAFVALLWFQGGFATPTPQPTEVAKVPTIIPPTVPPLPPTNTPEPGALPLIDINTPFMLGGQTVHGGIPGIDKIKQAGMTWVKIQCCSRDEGLTVDFGPAIENAHRNGLRILIGVVDKTDNKYNVTDPAYQQQYADYVVNLARQGADAIEVWNEMNIDREWPLGQISGTSYAQLINFVAPQIKAANANTIIISGAPAPTGFFGAGEGCSLEGCDDKPYIEQMTAAGVFTNPNIDCVGIHYNEGLVSPKQSTGDPRDNPDFYSRYYQTMVDTYWNASGGQKPLCFTELGYLSAEEWGYLPGNFSWNPPINLTVTEQAQYLSEAAQLSKQQGKVRLMIVFNVDFTGFPKPEEPVGDPQGGYAIIRPDGSCPACSALAAVMATP
jgi:hypothetical protein